MDPDAFQLIKCLIVKIAVKVKNNFYYYTYFPVEPGKPDPEKTELFNRIRSEIFRFKQDFYPETWVRINSTFSLFRPFSYRRFLYFDLSTSPVLLRLAYFDLLSNLGFLLVETYRSKYSFGRSKV